MKEIDLEYMKLSHSLCGIDVIENRWIKGEYEWDATVRPPERRLLVKSMERFTEALKTAGVKWDR